MNKTKQPPPIVTEIKPASSRPFLRVFPRADGATLSKLAMGAVFLGTVVGASNHNWGDLSEFRETPGTPTSVA